MCLERLRRNESFRALSLSLALCFAGSSAANGVSRVKISRGAVGVNQAPTITSISPSTGLCAGGRVKITGTGFQNASGSSVLAVDLNNVATSKVGIGSATQITVIIPDGATTGPFHVTTTSGKATSPTYTVSGCSFATTFQNCLLSGVPSGAVASRTGSDEYPQNGLNTVYKATAAMGYVCQDDGRGGGATLRTHPAYQNNAPTHPAVTPTGWTSTVATFATNAGPDPFGTNTATFLAATASGSNVSVSNAGPGNNACPAVGSTWSLTGNTPSQPPFSSAIGVPFPSGVQISTTPAWVRSFTYNTKGGSPGADFLGLFPMGCSGPSGVTPGTVTCNNGSGGANFWGAQTTDACGQGVDPLCDGSCGAATLQITGNLGNVVSGNDINLTGCVMVDPVFVGLINGPGFGPMAPRFWSMQTVDGESLIAWDDQTTVTIQVNGDSGNLTSLNIGNMTPGSYRPTQACWNLYSAPSAPNNGFWWRINGASAVNLHTALTGGTYTMHTPSQMWLGSDLGNPAIQMLSVGHTQIFTTLADPNTANGIILGDSQVATYTTVHSFLGGWTLSINQSQLNSIFSWATVGDTVQGQQALWDASPQKGQSYVTWVAIPGLGTNNLHAGETAATVAGRMQALVNDVHASNPAAKIIIAPLFPVNCAAWAIPIQSVLTEYNNDILGTGPNPVTDPGGGVLIRMPLWDAYANGTTASTYCWTSLCNACDASLEHGCDVCYATNGTSSLQNGIGGRFNSTLSNNALIN